MNISYIGHPGGLTPLNSIFCIFIKKSSEKWLLASSSLSAALMCRNELVQGIAIKVKCYNTRQLFHRAHVVFVSGAAHDPTWLSGRDLIVG